MPFKPPFKDKKAEYCVYYAVTYMKMFGFEKRDTFFVDYNWDDFHANGDRYNGDRCLEVEVTDRILVSTWDPGTSYTMDVFADYAYNSPSILIPQRLDDCKQLHAAVHEATHFVQVCKPGEKYIKYNGRNYTEYVSQRSELEAHIVQIAFIVERMLALVPEGKPTNHGLSQVRSNYEYLKNNYSESDAINLILKCHTLKLI